MGTLAYSGILWHTLAYSGILLHTLVYSGILWHTMAYSAILWNTLPYSCILWHIPDNCHFFTLTQFLENKIYTQKTRKLRQNTQKIANFCVITAKYTVNCQFFALNL